jgi:hypothetical protein
LKQTWNDNLPWVNRGGTGRLYALRNHRGGRSDFIFERYRIECLGRG